MASESAPYHALAEDTGDVFGAPLTSWERYENNATTGSRPVPRTSNSASVGQGPTSSSSRWSNVDKAPKASMTSSVFNLTNTILGTGVIAMPFTCMKGGFVMFVVLLLAIAVASDFAVKLLFRAVEIAEDRTAITSEHMSYSVLGKALGGKTYELLGSWSVTLQQIGCCIAYVVVIGDILGPIGKEYIWDDAWMRQIMQIVIVVFVIFPLCLVRRFDSLKYTSIAAVGFIIVFVAVVIGYGIKAAAFDHSSKGDTEIEHGSVRAEPKSAVDVIGMLPILSFAFLCHQNTFPIYREMRNPSAGRMSSVAHWSIGICACVYLSTGIFGYLIKKEESRSDLFTNFAITGTAINTVMDIVRTGFGTAIVFSYPIVVWEARRNLQVLVFGDMEFSFKHNLGLNFVIVFITATIGIAASEVETVLGVVGSTCSPMMVYVLPPLLFLKAVELTDPADREQYAKERVGAWILLSFGCMLIPLCVTMWFLGIIGVV